jgi:hypothetical protein
MDSQALPQVERLIIEGKKRIARQRDVVAAAFQEGRDTEIPVSMLRAFEASLRAFERHRQLTPPGGKGSQKSSREPYEDMARPGRRVTALFIAFSVQCQAATREIAAAVTVGLVAATFIVVWSSERCAPSIFHVCRRPFQFTCSIAKMVI